MISYSRKQLPEFSRSVSLLSILPQLFQSVPIQSALTFPIQRCDILKFIQYKSTDTQTGQSRSLFHVCPCQPWWAARETNPERGWKKRVMKMSRCNWNNRKKQKRLLRQIKTRNGLSRAESDRGERRSKWWKETRIKDADLVNEPNGCKWHSLFYLFYVCPQETGRHTSGWTRQSDPWTTHIRRNWQRRFVPQESKPVAAGAECHCCISNRRAVSQAGVCRASEVHGAGQTAGIKWAPPGPRPRITVWAD